MINYYFFKSGFETNAQGERRMRLRALPGQSTYSIATNSLVAVRTEMTVQASSESLHRIINAPEGTIWGVKIEGRTSHAASLKVYHRNNIDFYRVENAVHQEEFPAEMAAAYRIVANTVEPEIPMTAAEGADPANVAAEPQETTDRQQQLPESAFVPDEATKGIVAAIRQRAGEFGLEDHDILALSRLADRLAAGVVVFSYTKNSTGERRIAYGTRNRSVINAFSTSSVSDTRASQPFDGEHFYYYDLQRNAWRNFTVDNFLSFSHFVPAAQGCSPAVLDRLRQMV